AASVAELADPAVVGPAADEAHAERERVEAERAAAERIKRKRHADYFCPRMFKRIMIRKEDGAPAVFTCRCGCFACTGCGRRIRDTYKENVELRLRLSVHDGNTQFYQANFADNKSVRAMVRKRLSRHGTINHFKIRLNDGRFHVLAEKPFFGSQDLPPLD